MLLPAIASEQEVRAIQNAGIACETLQTTLALGNLIAINDEIAIGPGRLPLSLIKTIEEKLRVSFVALPSAGFDLLGAGIVLTNRGWIASPKLADAAFGELERITQKTGSLTSAQWGDPWIGNSVLANDHGALVGENSTAAELLHIDEGLSAAAK